MRKGIKGCVRGAEEVTEMACSVLGRTEGDDSKVEVETTVGTPTKLATCCSTLRLSRFLPFTLVDLPPSGAGPPLAVGVCDDVVDADWAVAAADAAAAAAAAADWAAEDVDGDEEDIVVGFDRFDSDITLFAADISAVSSTRTVQGGDA